MIDSITGIIKEFDRETLIIAAESIHWSLKTPSSTIAPLNEKSCFYIHLHWHAENGPSLFGFNSKLERTIFNLIISCSGIGPKIALALLSELSTERLIKIIQQKDHTALSKVNGIGNKKAEQITLQLKHKIDTLIKTESIEIKKESKDWHNLQQVLASLGYKNQEIQKALSFINSNKDMKDKTFDRLLQSSLSFLAKKR